MNQFFEIPMLLHLGLAFGNGDFNVATPRWYPGQGWCVTECRISRGGRGCAHNRWLLPLSLLSVGLIPTGGGVVYINNYRLAVVHRFERTKNTHIQKKKKGRRRRRRGTKRGTTVRPHRAASISWHQEPQPSPTCAGTGHTSPRRLVIAGRAGR